MKISTEFEVDNAYPMPSYSVLAADRLRVTWTFDLLILASHWSYVALAGHMVNPSTEFEAPIRLFDA